jgi:hypothetical protein
MTCLGATFISVAVIGLRFLANDAVKGEVDEFVPREMSTFYDVKDIRINSKILFYFCRIHIGANL